MIAKIKNKKGEWALEEIGKVIFYLILLLVAIFIVVIAIGGELGSQGDKIGGAFTKLR